MPDELNRKGLQVKTLPEIREELQADFKGIYGEDINIGQNSPDGQVINILAQAAVDLRELLQKVNSSFDPDQAMGRVLDQRVAINGIKRKGATYTRAIVNVQTSRDVNLVGMDDRSHELSPDVPNLFTVQDDAGTQFYLLESITLQKGTTPLEFRAKEIGRVEVRINTITKAVTLFAGVTDINNTSSALTTGDDEETDSQLKLRRRQSVTLLSVGYLEGIEASLLAIEGVKLARVYENNVDVPFNGIPGHSIWCIVEGGATADIADAIYRMKSAGAGMKGDVSESIARTNGIPYVVRFDRPEPLELVIKLKVYQKEKTSGETTGATITQEAAEGLKNEIVDGLIWSLGANAGADDVIDFIKDIHPEYRIRDVLLRIKTSDDQESSFSDIVSVHKLNQVFINNSQRIFINE